MKKIIVVSIIVAIGLVIVFIGITILLSLKSIQNEKEFFTGVQQLSSYAISMPIKNDQQKIEMFLDRPSINPKTPWTHQSFRINNINPDYIISKSNPNQLTIASLNESFELIFYVAGESMSQDYRSSLFRDPIDGGSLLGNLYKLYDQSLSTQINNLFLRNKTYWVFYNNRLNTTYCPTESNEICAGNFILLPLSDGDSIPINILCGVDDISKVYYCDNLIQNLVFEIVE